MTSTPHDALFKAVFERPEHAGALLRSVLPGAIVGAIDWATISLDSGTHVNSSLAETRSDLLFSVRLAGVQAYLLLEHQSGNDNSMPLRVMDCVVQLCRRQQKAEGLPLPIVIPTIVSHAVEGWTAPTRFEGIVAPDPATIPGLFELVPSFSFVVEDLRKLSNEQLRARALAAFPTLALWLLRDARDAKTLFENLQHWVDALADALAAPSGRESVRQLFRYVALVCGEVTFNDFRAKIRAALPAAEEVAMTIAEELMQKGREEGREEGREQGIRQGQRRLCENLLRLKFGELAPEFAEQLEAATVEQLERWAARILTADSLAQVFAPAN